MKYRGEIILNNKIRKCLAVIAIITMIGSVVPVQGIKTIEVHGAEVKNDDFVI